jgi:hypothetical protein
VEQERVVVLRPAELLLLQEQGMDLLALQRALGARVLVQERLPLPPVMRRATGRRTGKPA